MSQLGEHVSQLRGLLEKALSAADRHALPASDFVFPEREAWPINDLAHAKIALSYMKQGKGDAAEYPAIRKAIRKKYPDLQQ